MSNGRISQTTYDLLDKNASRLVSAYASLKQNIDEEKDFWAMSNSEEVRALEQILIDFKVRHFLGDMNDEEWKKKSETIISGLNVIKEPIKLMAETDLQPIPALELPIEEDSIEIEKKLPLEQTELETIEEIPEKKSEEKREIKPKRIIKKKNVSVTHVHKKTVIEKLSKPEKPTSTSSLSEIHCMNPWNLKCRSTDIELTIYYKDQPTPICRGCWKEISQKDIEWSGP